MRVPIRKAGPYTHLKPDTNLTEEKYAELSAKLDKLKNVKRPREAAEVKRLALMGDFSENAGYQLAKGRLRGINQRILDIEYLLKHADIIRPDANSDKVQLGHLVTLETEGQRKDYRILGGAETDPTRGIISHNSPLGAALINKQVGDEVEINLADRTKIYKIIKIS